MLGAFVDGKLAGFNYSFPGFRGGRVYLCSHMTGVETDYQKQGLGVLLKEKQNCSLSADHVDV